jgi:RNA polymerase sigma-70 factor (ECF subfamily)
MAAADEAPSRRHRQNPVDGNAARVDDEISSDHPDRATIDAIHLGDRQAFEALYLERYTTLRTFALRYLPSPAAAEDVIHDVFLAIWRGRERWSPQRSIDAYLFAAIRNRALKQVRHQRVQQSHYAQTVVGETTPSTDAQTNLERAEQHQNVQRVLASLPERHATALVLRWHRGLTYPEIAQILGVSPQAARTLVLRVQETLKRLLSDLSD